MTTNTLLQMWHHFSAEAVEQSITPEVREDARRIFYSGAAALVAVIIQAREAAKLDPDEPALAIDLLAAELESEGLDVFLLSDVTKQ